MAPRTEPPHHPPHHSPFKTDAHLPHQNPSLTPRARLVRMARCFHACCTCTCGHEPGTLPSTWLTIGLQSTWRMSDVDADPRDLEAFAGRFSRADQLGVTQADVV
ncbi:unnamed protein product [Boreogadus saida]